MDRNHLARSHHGGQSPASIDRLSFLELRHTISTICANKKLMWNQAQSFCKERNLSSIPDDCNTFYPASSSQPRQQRLFVKYHVTKHVVCSFGLCAGLIRQREFPADAFVRCQNVMLETERYVNYS